MQTDEHLSGGSATLASLRPVTLRPYLSVQGGKGDLAGRSQVRHPRTHGDRLAGAGVKLRETDGGKSAHDAG